MHSNDLRASVDVDGVRLLRRICAPTTTAQLNETNYERNLDKLCLKLRAHTDRLLSNMLIQIGSHSAPCVVAVR